MALGKKRAAKAAEKAQKQATKSVESAGAQLDDVASSLSSTAEKKADKAVEGLHKFADSAGTRVSEGAEKAGALVDQYRPQVEEGLRNQGEKISAFADRVAPAADKFRHDLQEDYLPRARKTAEATNTVVSAAVGAAADAARRELDKGQGEIVKAAAPAKKKGKGGKVLLVLGLAAAGAAAGYLVWKKTRPVEDPWAPPADFARAHYPSATSSETDGVEISDAVAGAEAGDVASSLKGDAPATPDEKAEDASSAETPNEEGDAKRGTHRGDA